MWLSKAVVAINNEVFKPVKLEFPEKWAISCGWVKGSGPKAIGVCVDPLCSADGTTELFVVPTQSEPMSVLGTITHEMVHAIVGLKEKHDGMFISVCKALGMKKPWTQCGPVPGTALWSTIEGIAQALGPYPHAAVVPRKKPTEPQTEHRWISRRNPKFGVLISTGTIIKIGRPKDPWGEDLIPKYPDRVFRASPVNEQLKDMYELPTKNAKAGAVEGFDAGKEPVDDQDSDD